MKIGKLLFVAALCAVFLGSCKKDSYVCDCTYSDGTTTMTDSNLIGEKSSISDAEVDCGAHETELINSGAVSTDCSVSVVE